MTKVNSNTQFADVINESEFEAAKKLATDLIRTLRGRTENYTNAQVLLASSMLAAGFMYEVPAKNIPDMIVFYNELLKTAIRLLRKEHDLEPIMTPMN